MQPSSGVAGDAEPDQRGPMPRRRAGGRLLVQLVANAARVAFAVQHGRGPPRPPAAATRRPPEHAAAPAAARHHLRSGAQGQAGWTAAAVVEGGRVNRPRATRRP